MNSIACGHVGVKLAAGRPSYGTALATWRPERRGLYLLTVLTANETTTIPYVAVDDAHAMAQAMLWWAAQAEGDRAGMTVEVAALAVGRLAVGGSKAGPTLWTYGGCRAAEGGGL